MFYEELVGVGEICPTILTEIDEIVGPFRRKNVQVITAACGSALCKFVSYVNW
jgi:hypothetical protein